MVQDPHYVQDGTPTISSVTTVSSVHLWKSNQMLLFKEAIVVDSSSRDWSSSPGTTLKKGLVMAKLSASGRCKHWAPDSPASTNGIPIGLLNNTISVASGHAHGELIRGIGFYSYTAMHTFDDTAHTDGKSDARVALLPGGKGQTLLLPSFDQVPAN